jgi:competence protein ComEC
VTAGAAWAVATALWAGCLAGGPWWAALLGVAVVMLGAVAPNPGRRLALVMVGMALVGAGTAGGRAELADRAALFELSVDGGRAQIGATVVTEPRESAAGAWAVIRVTRLHATAIRERAVLRLAGVDEVELGDELAFTATARPLGSRGFDAHLRRLHAVAALDPVGGITVVRPADGAWALTNLVRERTRQMAWARLPPERAAVLTGLLTGDVRGQSLQRREQLAAAGLTHLVVVSGRHVGLVLVGVLGSAALLRVGARGRRVAAIVALMFYVVLVRWQPSVLRAGLMAGLVLGAGLLGRRAEPRHGLAMAVIVLLCVDPLLAGHLGFGLSVSATAGVLLLAPWLAGRLPGPRPVRLLVAASIGAQAGAAPLLLNLEGGIGYGSVPANLVAVPAAAAAQVIGLVAAAAGMVSTGLGGWTAQLASPFLGLILLVAEHAASTPRLDVATLLSPVAGALVLVVLARRRAPRLAVCALLLAVGAATLPSLLPAPPVTEFAVTMLDVGQGDAVLVEVPGPGGGARMLVDAGPDETTALARLRRLGVRHLDLVVVSHAHHDHTGGLPAVLRGIDVGMLLTGPAPPDPSLAALSAGEAERVAVQRGVPIQRVAAGQRFALGSALVRVLSPPADGSLGADLNENSVVLHVATEAGAALLTGDAEELAQERMLRTPAGLRADLLKVPHHGGNTSLEGFFDAVGAHTALIGVGQENTYGHPHPVVLEHLGRARVLRTDVDGTVGVVLDADGPRVRRRRTRRQRGSAGSSSSVMHAPGRARGLPSPGRCRQDPARSSPGGGPHFEESCRGSLTF